MRKISTLLMGIVLGLLPVAGFAQVSIDAATAWFNNETFESYELGDLPDNGGWTLVSSGATAPKIDILTDDNPCGTSAAQKYLRFTGSKAQTVNKNFTALSGYVYVKMAFTHATYGETYTLQDAGKKTVFQFKGNNINSNSIGDISFTDIPNTTVGLGKRGGWTEVEFILDLKNNRIVNLLAANDQLSKKTYMASDVPLSTEHDGSIVYFNVNYRAEMGGLDNITIAELFADKIKDLTGDAELQTLDATSVSKSYSATAFATAMEVDVPVGAGTKADVVWTISDWGTLPAGEQSKVSLTRSETNYDSAELSVTDAVSANATITVKAELNGIELTKQVTLKAVSTVAMKEALQTEITAATNLSAVIESGITPYLDGVKSTLASAVSVAQGVYDNASADAVTIQGAIETLQTAQTGFTAALVPYNDFVAAIAPVQAVHDEEVRDAPFFSAIKATLQSAINAATSAQSTVASGEDITAAQTALADALTAFNAAIPHYTGLDEAIVSATTIYLDAYARIGEKFLNYKESEVDTLNLTIVAAIEGLSTETTTEALDSVKTALNEALSLSAGNRVEPGNVRYKIYSYGEGTNTPSTKTIMYVDESYEEGSEEAVFALKPYKIEGGADFGENAQWTIVEMAPNQYSIQNVGTGKYLQVVGLSDSTVTITLPEIAVGTTTFIDEGYFFYGIANAAGTTYIRQRDNTTPRYEAYSRLGRYDECFQFEPVGEDPATVTLTLQQPSSGGSLEVSPEQTAYGIGDEVTVTAVPGENYVLKNFVVNGIDTPATSGNTLTLTMDEDKTVTAVFDAASGINNPGTSKGTIVSEKYYTLSGVEVSKQAAGILIKKTVYGNGAVEITKAIKK